MSNFKLRDILVILILFVFTVMGLFITDEILWFPVLFFGIGSITFICFIIPEKSQPAIADDEVFLKFHGTGSFEYYDWGFYDIYSERGFSWEKIQKVTSYKEDRIVNDEVCIICIFMNGDVFVITEETPGWNQFITNLEETLIIKNGWLKSVIKPAFRRNETVIFER